MDVMDADSLRAKVRQVVDEQERFCKDVQAAVAASRDTKRKIAQGKAVLPKFAIGVFVLYARVRRQGVTPKLVSTWTCLLYTSPSPRDQRGSRMPSSA